MSDRVSTLAHQFTGAIDATGKFGFRLGAD